jgi:hypothetical protein
VRRGGTLVTARVDDDRALTTWEILQRYKSVDPVVLGPNSAASVTSFTVMTASLSRLPMPGLAGVASGLLASILELRQQFQTFFCTAWEHQLFVDKLRALVWNRDQVIAHAEEAADRQHGKWVLSVGAHEEIVDLTNGFVGGVGNAAADDLGRAIAGS